MAIPLLKWLISSIHPGCRFGVLVVDDDPNTCSFLKAVFTTVGQQCHTFLRPEEAEQYLNKNEADLAMVDVYLGAIKASICSTGCALCRRVRPPGAIAADCKGGLRPGRPLPNSPFVTEADVMLSARRISVPLRHEFPRLRSTRQRRSVSFP
jgi:CheY-like chemotaxis protein